MSLTDSQIVDIAIQVNPPESIDILEITPASVSIVATNSGPRGIQGEQGEQGEQGIQGIQGIQGLTGGVGPDGAPGSVWRNGSGAPSNGLGINGDYYLNDDNGDVYFKAGGTYSVVANIKGPAGDDGAPGADGTNGSDGAPGADGEDGADGAPGAPGTPGSVWRNGSGAPSNGLGVNGDYYLDDDTGDVYLKSGGTYSLETNIKGADGVGGGGSTEVTVSQTAHGLSVGNAIKVSGSGTYAKAQADSPANAEVVGVVSVVTDANNFKYIPGGMISTLSGLTAGEVYFLSDATAGLLTTTAPTDVGSVSKPLLVAVTSTAGVIMNMRGYSIVDTPLSDNTQLVNQTAHGLAIGDVVRFNGTNYVKAKADSSINAEVVGIVSGVEDADNFHLLHSGYMASLSGLTAGSVYFLSDATAGLLTINPPTTIGSVNKPLFIAVSTTSGYFVNWRGQVLANAGADGWYEANETWIYASADAPTYTFTVAADVTTKYTPGMRVKLTQTTVKYFIITAVSAYSGGSTTITVYGGTDYTLANAAISGNYYSMVKAPVGFPLDPNKWTVTVISNTADVTQGSPVSGTWYNLGSLSGSIPIGVWDVRYDVLVDCDAGATTNVRATLSTANNSESNQEMTCFHSIDDTASDRVMHMFTRSRPLVMAAKTTHYLNAQIISGSAALQVDFRGDQVKTLVTAECAYL